MNTVVILLSEVKKAGIRGMHAQCVLKMVNPAYGDHISQIKNRGKTRDGQLCIDT